LALGAPRTPVATWRHSFATRSPQRHFCAVRARGALAPVLTPRLRVIAWGRLYMEEFEQLAKTSAKSSPRCAR